MRARVFIACALLASCSNKASDHSSSGGSDVSASGDIVKGTLSIDGAPVTDLVCRPGAAVHVFLDVVSSKGTLHVEDGKLAWDGEPLTCEKFERSWGGGRHLNSDGSPSASAYWRGTLSFACVRGSQKIEGSLELDCGGITAEERASLDKNRQQTLENQNSVGPK